MKVDNMHMLLASAAVVPGALALSGEFTVLSMNVAGLPQILQDNEVPGDKATNAGTIGSYFAKYNFDMIHIQEDFNYHSNIYATDKHPYRTSTSGGVPFGSGLNSLSNFDWVDFERTKWDTCSDASSNDCLTPKGFTFMRAKISSDGSTAVYADFYNMHTDAGTEAGDLTARTSNLRQVATHIMSYSGGNAVFVFGDSNSRYTRQADVGLKEMIASINPVGAGMTDAWVELERGGVIPTEETLCDNPSTTNYCETVDKVLYRSSPLVKLSAIDWTYASSRFLQSDGNILSDHNPVLANFTFSSGDKLQQTEFYGGEYGGWYTDVPTLGAYTGAVPKPSQLNFRGASRLDSVSITLADGTTFTHGGGGGDLSTLTLADGEFWTNTTLCWGEKSGKTRIFYIKATTTAGNVLMSGSTTSNCKALTAPAGWQVVGFVGRDGDEMDRMSLIYAPQ